MFPICAVQAVPHIFAGLPKLLAKDLQVAMAVPILCPQSQ